MHREHLCNAVSLSLSDLTNTQRSVRDDLTKKTVDTGPHPVTASASPVKTAFAFGKPFDFLHDWLLFFYPLTSVKWMRGQLLRGVNREMVMCSITRSSVEKRSPLPLRKKFLQCDWRGEKKREDDRQERYKLLRVTWRVESGEWRVMRALLHLTLPEEVEPDAFCSFTL